MATNPEVGQYNPTEEDIVVKGVLSGATTESISRWDSVPDAITRGVIVKAASIRQNIKSGQVPTDPGHAYLEGIADGLAAVKALGQVAELEAKVQMETVPELNTT